MSRQREATGISHTRHFLLMERDVLPMCPGDISKIIIKIIAVLETIY